MKYKALRLQVKNIGIVGDADIEVNKPLIVFWGACRTGKSTMLNAIKLLFGGSFSNDLLKHGTDFGYVDLELSNESKVRREFYRTEEGVIKSRPIKLILDGEEMGKPTEHLAKLVNPFILDDEFFIKKSDLERSRYLVELFNVDTSEFDNEISTIESENKTLRTEVKLYGDIDTKEVAKPASIDALKKERDDLENHNKAQDLRQSVIDYYKRIASGIRKQSEDDEYTTDHETSEAIAEFVEVQIAKLPKPEYKNEELQAIQEKISANQADQLRYESYLERVEKAKEKKKKEDQLKENDVKLRNLRAKRVKKLSDSSDMAGIEGFKFTETGGFEYQNTASDMLSTSQLKNLSQELRGKYIDGIQLSLLDKAESLGRSIYELVDKAKNNDLNILCSVVSEKFTPDSDEIGVFYMDNGEITTPENSQQ